MAWVNFSARLKLSSTQQRMNLAVTCESRKGIHITTKCALLINGIK